MQQDQTTKYIHNKTYSKWKEDYLLGCSELGGYEQRKTIPPHEHEQQIAIAESETSILWKSPPKNLASKRIRPLSSLATLLFSYEFPLILLGTSRTTQRILNIYIYIYIYIPTQRSSCTLIGVSKKAFQERGILPRNFS